MAKNDLQGTLDLLVLKTLDQNGALHGYGIVLHIQSASNDLLRVEEGSLYPALHRMEQSGWISAEWSMTETNRRAKYYKLTASGPSPAGSCSGELRSARPRRSRRPALRLKAKYHGVHPWPSFAA